MATKITATELARNLSDILNRVRYKGESFVVIRGGESVAVLEPPLSVRLFTVADLKERFGERTIPEGIAEAIEEGRKALREIPDSPWPSS
jgi:antitoxin (DNA-binding transcriptional repressor) of toxin-antitoxin stability system